MWTHHHNKFLVDGNSFSFFGAQERKTNKKMASTVAVAQSEEVPESWEQVWREKKWIRDQPTRIIRAYMDVQKEDWDTVVIAKRRRFYEVYGHNVEKFEQALNLPLPRNRHKRTEDGYLMFPMNGFSYLQLDEMKGKLDAARINYKIIELN